MKSNKLIRLTVKNNPAFHSVLMSAPKIGFMDRFKDDIIAGKIMVSADYDKQTIEISGDIESVGDNQKKGISVLEEFMREKERTKRLPLLQKAGLVIEVVENEK